jgi:hypothetical protein
MGQIFHACVYDLKKKVCSVFNADKFYANCYSFSGAVAVTHYLLHKKPHNVMWGGNYAYDFNCISSISRNQILLGFSTYLDPDELLLELGNLKNYTDPKKARKTAEYIAKNSKKWTKENVFEKAINFFDMDKTKSVLYKGFVVNHDKKLAINLEDYYNNSTLLMSSGEEYVADLIPVLTETGGGIDMLLFDGAGADTTDELASTWCGDLLEIVDSAPTEYELINCNITPLRARLYYCYYNFGLDSNNFLFKNVKKDLFEAVSCKFFLESGIIHNIVVEKKVIPHDTNANYYAYEGEKEKVKLIFKPIKRISNFTTYISEIECEIEWPK